MMRPKDLRQGSGTKTFLDAMHGGKVHLARFILDALDGRIINSKTENNRTPLMFAVRLQDPGPRAKFTQLLLEKEADVNCQDEDGRTALSHACELGHVEVVKLLVQFNADPDISDVWGNSSLMYAAFSGHSQVLEFLVRAFKRLGLRLDRTNSAGHSAIQVAKFFGHHQCVQVLNVPCRKGALADDRLADAGGSDAGEIGRPNRLPKHVLERFSSKNGDQLPGVFQRQLKIGDSNGLFNRFRCPGGQSPEDSTPQRPHWTQPHPPERGETEGDNSVLFTSKQLQNCQLRDQRGGKTFNSVPEPSQKDVRGLKKDRAESLPLWGKAKSFNLDLLNARKQSYQGEVCDNNLSASRLKRASLQDERALIGKMECQGSTKGLTGDTDTTVPVPKALFSGMSHSVRVPGENGGPQRDGGNDAIQSVRREQPKRGSLPIASSRTNHKLLFARRDVAEGAGDATGRAPGLTSLGSRLLRRFTAPEFMRMVIDCSPGSSHGRGQISRSETFPFSNTHMQVNSQPSVDSISGVKCEFESSASQATLH